MGYTGEILISGGTIVNEGRCWNGYLLVRDGVIAETGEGTYPGDDGFRGRVIDATGRIVMPGMIDAHVHFREPGLTAKGDMASESAAAVAGGITSVLEMPNTVPPAVSREELEHKFELAEGRMHTNYSFFLGATVDNLQEIKRYEAEGGKLVKLFMGSSTGGMLVADDKALRALFDQFGGVIAAHCEDETLIRANTEHYKQQTGPTATAAIHPLVRSAEACYRATARAVELADRYNSLLHVCHLTTERELALFASGPVPGKRITAEVCVPHLWFTDEDYARLGNLIKCNPAIKSTADREALRQALTGVGEWRGRVDLVATDHAPHTREEKARGYWEAPSGIPSVQHSLPMMFTLVKQGLISLETIVEKMCHAPALRFGIDRRGFLRDGYAADITIVDGAGWSVRPDGILSKCGWSPWEGTRFETRVATTIVGGRVAWDGERVAEKAAGERLVFTNN
jgi:dihydroorotase